MYIVYPRWWVGYNVIFRNTYAISTTAPFLAQTMLAMKLLVLYGLCIVLTCSTALMPSLSTSSTSHYKYITPEKKDTENKNQNQLSPSVYSLLERPTLQGKVR